jgi:cytoskeletal protein RodZ
MKSVGELLRSQREKRKLTVEDVYKSIKVHPSYIRALENDDYSSFEGKVHAKGFLKMYAEFLNLNLDEINALWRREFETLFENTDKDKSYLAKKVENNVFAITPSLVAGIFGIFLIFAFFGYLFHQYRTYTGNPAIEVNSPSNNLVLATDIVDVTGRTELDTEVFVNNQQVILTPNGSFAVSVKLKEGINTISITAVNKLEKKSEEIRTVIYRPEKLPAPPPVAPESSESTPSSEETSGAEDAGENDTL